MEGGKPRFSILFIKSSICDGLTSKVIPGMEE
jgi:hypothetical protein